MRVELKEVIVTKIENRGDGTDNNPFRTITQVWNKDGTLLGEADPFTALGHLALINFASYCIENNIKYITSQTVLEWTNQCAIQKL